MAAWCDDALGGHPALRPVDAGALHVTLVFLGSRAEAEAAAIAAAAFAALEGLRAPSLSARGLVWLPPRRPRLLALDLADEDGRAARLQGAAAEALAAAGRFTPEERAFWPHVTLARGRGNRPPPRAIRLAAPAVRFQARQVTLYRSLLHPAGARYEPLGRMTLAA